MGPWGRLVENISSRLAFFPPHPPTYSVREHNDGSHELYLQPMQQDVPKVLQCKVKIVSTRPPPSGCSGSSSASGGTKIVTAFFPYTSRSSGQPAKLTLLYSHGNAVDLGHMLPVYRELARLLKVNVMGYDYSGYGCSTGVPTVANTLSDIAAVLNCLSEDYGIPRRRVVLYGQSVGSGPSVHLGAECGDDIGGVILHSPLLSGVRVLRPHISFWPSWADVYPNHLLAPRIKRPVLVMHGTEDEVIHISCGKKLASLCPNAAPPLWAQGYGHQDLELCSGYLPALVSFLAQLDKDPACS